MIVCNNGLCSIGHLFFYNFKMYSNGPRIARHHLKRYCSSSSGSNGDSNNKNKTSDIDITSLKKTTRQFDISDKSQMTTEYRKVSYPNPISRTVNILKDDLKILFGLTNFKKKGTRTLLKLWPSYCDVLIIGGGAIGSAIAYHLKQKALDGLNVVVVEKDPTYTSASSVRSVGGIRQQFSIPENIQLSLYGSEFLQHASDLLAVDGLETPSVNFSPHGYLTLSSEEGVEQLRDNFKLQQYCGASVLLLNKAQLKEKFPWLNVNDVEAGVLGTENEGWFDPWSLLIALRQKAIALGTDYVSGEVTKFNQDFFTQQVIQSGNFKKLRSVDVTLPDGEVRTINFALCIIAAGAWSGNVAKLAGVGVSKEELLSVELPIEPRKRYVFCVNSAEGPGLNCPLVIDSNKTYFRREGLGNMYLCGASPSSDEEPATDDLEVDYNYFEKTVWPSLANRVSAFNALKGRCMLQDEPDKVKPTPSLKKIYLREQQNNLHSAWAGYYDYNTFDQNGIVGLHPVYVNLCIASGFSGHGIQQAAGIGRAIMELILYGEYKSLDLSRFGFERILMNEPLLEHSIY